MSDKVRERVNARREEAQKRKRRIIIIAIVVILLIICCIIFTNVMKSRKTTETGEQPIEEQNVDEDQNLIENQIDDQIDNEEEPVNENEVNENEIKESKITNEKQVKESTNKYYIKVNNQVNVVTIYTKDANGDYTKPVKAMVCSAGTATPTSGKYKMTGAKHIFHTLFGHTPGTYVYGQYSTSIVGNILFHSVPYTQKGNPASLEYLEYDKLGTRASAGCIRLTVADARWIYNNINKGTIVEFYSSANAGPLGKPSAQKISGNVECRGWDPTDPNPQNPWRTYKEKNNSDGSNNNSTSNNNLAQNSEKIYNDNSVTDSKNNNNTKNNTSSNTNAESENSEKDNNLKTNNTSIVNNDTVKNNTVTNNKSIKNQK